MFYLLALLSSVLFIQCSFFYFLFPLLISISIQFPIPSVPSLMFYYLPTINILFFILYCNILLCPYSPIFLLFHFLTFCYLFNVLLSHLHSKFGKIKHYIKLTLLYANILVNVIKILYTLYESNLNTLYFISK